MQGVIHFGIGKLTDAQSEAHVSHGKEIFLKEIFLLRGKCRRPPPPC